MHGRTYIFWANLTPFSLQRWDAEQGLGRHELQLEIVSRGLELLKPGGRLVYSTVRARAGRGHAAFAFSTTAPAGNPFRALNCASIQKRHRKSSYG